MAFGEISLDQRVTQGRMVCHHEGQHEAPGPWLLGGEAVEEAVEHGYLAPSGNPVRVQDALGAQPVDERHQLMGGEIEVEPAGKLAEARRLGQVTSQPGPEPVKLGVLQLPQRGRAQRPAPEADLDLRLALVLEATDAAFAAVTGSAPRRANPVPATPREGQR